MFESFKKKLMGWMGKEETKKVTKTKTQKKSKPKSSKTAKSKVSKKSSKKPDFVEQKEESKIEQDLIKTLVQEETKDIQEEQEPKTQSFFSKLFKKVSTSLSYKVTQEDFDEIFMELELILLENNVALEVVDKIKESLSKTLLGIEIKKSDMEKKITDTLKSSILDVLIDPPNLIDQINQKKESPFIMLFFGINGTGKTTSIAKLAYQLKKQNISCVLAAADTFRAASIEQLKTHAEKIKVPIVSHDYGVDPSAVAFDAIQYAKKNSIKVVLIDTAGRMYTKANLMKEMEKIIRVAKPDLKIFVGESITGNDATEQAKTFNDTAGIDGIILSKADVDDKSGTILSVSYVTKKPIYFLGMGQTYDDLKKFSKKEVLKHLGLD